MHATNLTAPLSVHTSDGSSTIEHIDGDVSLGSSDGHVAITDVRGSVAAQTSDGAITAGPVTGSVTTHTRDGRTTISAVGGDVEARSSDGPVTVYGNGQPVALTMTGGRQADHRGPHRPGRTGQRHHPHLRRPRELPGASQLRERDVRRRDAGSRGTGAGLAAFDRPGRGPDARRR